MKKLLPLALIASIALPSQIVMAGTDALGNYISEDGDAAPAKGDPLAKLKLADTPFEVCKSKAFIPAKIYNEDKQYWDQAMKECGSDIGLEVLPDDSLLTIRTILGKLDGGENDQAKAVEFLKKVGEKARDNIDFNIKVTERMEYCATNPKEEGCEKVIKELGKSIEKVRPEFRQALALSNYGDLNQRQANIDGKNNINREMGPASMGLEFESTSFKKEKGRMEPLSDDEFAKAKDTYDNEDQEIQKKWDATYQAQMDAIDAKRKAGQGNPGLDRIYDLAKSRVGNYKTGDFLKFQTAKRSDMFGKHREDLVKAISRAPILAYMTKNKAAEECLDGNAEGCHALAMAAKKLKENSEKEKAKVVALLNGDQKVSSMLGLMGYGPAVRDALGKGENYCQSATGLANLVSNQKTAKNIGIGVGMAVGFMAGGYGAGAGLAAMGLEATTATVLGAVGAGAIVGGASIYHDAMEVKKEEQKVLGHATEDDGKDVADIKDLTEAKQALADNIITSPFNMVGTGVSGLFASQAAARIARMEANTALRTALKAKGHDEAGITQMFKDLSGKDVAKAQKAAATMMNDLGMEEDTLAVMKKAASKGLVSQITQRAAAKAIREDIKNAPQAKRVMEILNEVNPAKINEGNRQQVLEAALAGARFGIDNPKYLAAKINDWEQGLDGLAATFRRAEGKLKAVKGDQDKAMRLALKEEIDENPELKALSQEKKDEMVDQLATCGLKGK